MDVLIKLRMNHGHNTTQEQAELRDVNNLNTPQNDQPSLQINTSEQQKQIYNSNNQVDQEILEKLNFAERMKEISEKKCDDFKMDIEKCRGQIAQLNEDLVQKSRKLDDFLAESQSKVQNLNSQIEKKESEVERLKEELESARSAQRTGIVMEYEGKIDTLEASLLESRQKEVESRGSMNKLLKSLEELNYRNDLNEHDLKESEEIRKKDGEEKEVTLTNTIQNLRGELMNKSKASTAGFFIKDLCYFSSEILTYYFYLNNRMG